MLKLIQNMKVKQRKPLTEWLYENYGGQWKHHPFSGTWSCLDDDRIVRRCASYDSVRDEYSTFFSTYYLYDKNGATTIYPKL